MKRKQREPVTLEATPIEAAPVRVRQARSKSADLLVRDPLQIAALRARQLQKIGEVVSSDRFIVGGIAVMATYLFNHYMESNHGMATKKIR